MAQLSAFGPSARTRRRTLVTAPSPGGGSALELGEAALELLQSALPRPLLLPPVGDVAQDRSDAADGAGRVPLDRPSSAIRRHF
jgi:hypothetical protein